MSLSSLYEKKNNFKLYRSLCENHPTLPPAYINSPASFLSLFTWFPLNILMEYYINYIYWDAFFINFYVCCTHAGNEIRLCFVATPSGFSFLFFFLILIWPSQIWDIVFQFVGQRDRICTDWDLLTLCLSIHTAVWHGKKSDQRLKSDATGVTQALQGTFRCLNRLKLWSIWNRGDLLWCGFAMLSL